MEIEKQTVADIEVDEGPTCLANNLRILRRRWGLSQMELAERLGLNRGNIASYEKGSAEPKLCNLLKISKLFKISIADLTQGDLDDDTVFVAAQGRFSQPSGDERQVIEQFFQRAEEIDRFLESIHHCYRFKTESLQEAPREVQMLMSYFDQIHEVAHNLMRQHRTALDFLRCKSK